jgi:hypothetical protein
LNQNKVKPALGEILAFVALSKEPCFECAKHVVNSLQRTITSNNPDFSLIAKIRTDKNVS